MERAKQFMPFDALKGLREALLEKEKQITIKREPTDDELNKLNNIFPVLKKGQIIEIEYYKDSNYVKLTGIITNINIAYRTITIANEKISFSDIINIFII